MPARLQSRAALAGAILAMALPATATAADLEPLKRCYVSVTPEIREPLLLDGEGFTPNAFLEMRVDGDLVSTEQADPLGYLGPMESVSAPYQPEGQRTFQVSIAEQGNPLNVVTRTTRVTALDVDLRPASAKPSRVIRWSGRGFMAQRRIHAHYIYRGRSRKTVVLGRPSGPCGTFSVRRRQFPFTPRTGTWTVQVDQDARHRSRPRSNYVRLAIIVSRTGG
jgi:hypothetical protein